MPGCLWGDQIAQYDHITVLAAAQATQTAAKIKFNGRRVDSGLTVLFAQRIALVCTGVVFRARNMRMIISIICMKQT